MNAEMIKKLQENEAKFGHMDSDMKDAAISIGWHSFLLLDSRGDWVNAAIDFLGDFRYQLRSDYQPEPEVIRCEVLKEGTEFRFNVPGELNQCLELAPRYINFIGYQYDDGSITSDPRRINYDTHSKVRPGISAHRPKYVLFAKGD